MGASLCVCVCVCACVYVRNVTTLMFAPFAQGAGLYVPLQESDNHEENRVGRSVGCLFCYTLSAVQSVRVIKCAHGASFSTCFITAPSWSEWRMTTGLVISIGRIACDRLFCETM